MDKLENHLISLCRDFVKEDSNGKYVIIKDIFGSRRVIVSCVGFKDNKEYFMGSLTVDSGTLINLNDPEGNLKKYLYDKGMIKQVLKDYPH